MSSGLSEIIENKTKLGMLRRLNEIVNKKKNPTNLEQCLAQCLSLLGLPYKVIETKWFKQQNYFLTVWKLKSKIKVSTN